MNTDALIRATRGLEYELGVCLLKIQQHIEKGARASDPKEAHELTDTLRKLKGEFDGILFAAKTLLDDDEWRRLLKHLACPATEAEAIVAATKTRLSHHLL